MDIFFVIIIIALAITLITVTISYSKYKNSTGKIKNLQAKEEELSSVLEEISKKKNVEVEIVQSLLKQKQELLLESRIYENEKEEKLNQLHDLNNQIVEMQKTSEETLKSRTKLEDEAFKNYCDKLQKDYEEKEKEYADLAEKLEDAYDERQDSLIKEADKIEKELAKIKATRQAVMEANRKEEVIKANPADFSLVIGDADLSDIKVLERVKAQLSNKRVLAMLIWSTWFQKPMTALCNKLIGTTEKTGIYKITNLVTNECYIGQAAKLSDRWKQHAKCGLGIDTPQGNKLYKSMIEYGIWNFSWEVLEECKQSELNEKERFYINLYDSYNYGFNSTSGNK